MTDFEETNNLKDSDQATYSSTNKLNETTTTQATKTEDKKLSPTVSWIITFIFVGLSIAVIFANYFYVQWILSLGINWAVFFLYAWPNHTEKLYDFTGMITFLSVFTFSFIYYEAYNYTRCILIYIFVMLWSLRLGVFLLDRILGEGQDSRFNGVRDNFSRFFMMWSIQGIWVYYISYSATVIFYQTNNNDITTTDIVGIVIFWIALIIEVVSDHQKSMFKKNSENRNNFIKTGLWKYSRHPNYFGEISLWIGIFIVATSVARKWEYIMVISPLFTIFLLVFVSGIPLAEKHSDKKFGGRQDYIEYKNSTPVLIPFFYCWK